MNLSKPLHAASRFLFSLFLRYRTYLPQQKCHAFTQSCDGDRSSIGSIFVINLDRQPGRWTDVRRELSRIVDAAGKPLSDRSVRYSAYDAQSSSEDLLTNAEIEPFYTLGDQLFVEPQPLSVPDAFDLTRPIKMSAAEVAVARSHIGIWKAIAQSDEPYSLVLEDDVWFTRGFGRAVDKAWLEMGVAESTRPEFDVLYLSYKEVRYGAPKVQMSKNVFRPERGLWYLSGYVLSKKGAQTLLGLLPCRGPVDLWINHKFSTLDIRAYRNSVINQRLDLNSTNSYSILPALSKIGILDGGVALFHRRPTNYPVFAFGYPGSGLSSLAMALSMLGFRCCSDMDQIPEREFESLLTDHADRIFDAYVNIESLRQHLHLLMKCYPRAKFIVLENMDVTTDLKNDDLLHDLREADTVHLHGVAANSWRALCEHLILAPPDAPYPSVPDIGQRRHRQALTETLITHPAKLLRHDLSPWVVNSYAEWAGISSLPFVSPESSKASRVHFEDDLTDIQSTRWILRNDTFPGNLGLFRPANVKTRQGGGLSLTVVEEPLGVRNFSAAAISSRGDFLFGRFEATLQATNVPGLVTGFFLHRNSPRQEIDVEITGDQPNRLLVNVFYNPGAEGAKFDYGYRGTPVSIALGFDASKALHRFAIEWEANEIRWFVDGELVHRRVNWAPTPIPHLPMTLHVNTWPTRSRELAGKLTPRAMPASAIVRQIAVNAFNIDVTS